MRGGYLYSRFRSKGHGDGGGGWLRQEIVFILLIQIKVGHGGPGSCLRTENFLTPSTLSQVWAKSGKGWRGFIIKTHPPWRAQPSPALPMVIVMTQVPPMGLAATPQPGHEATLRETGVGTCWEVFNKQLSQEGTPISMV